MWDGCWLLTQNRPKAGGASGHLEQLPSRRFRVDAYAGTDPLTGRRLRYRQTVRTEEQARILLGKLLEQRAEGRGLKPA
jgi:integrase